MELKRVIAIALLSSVVSVEAFAGSENSFNKTTDTKKIGWMIRGKDAAKAKLKDPESARFRNVYFHRGVDNIPMTCGEVNSKNSFGAYGGYQRFISAGKQELTFLEEQVAGFGESWDRFCR